MHSLGQFFGHVWKGITHDPHHPRAARVVHRETQHEQRDTPQGKVVLRRTLIEEVVLDGEPEGKKAGEQADR